MTKEIESNNKMKIKWSLQNDKLLFCFKNNLLVLNLM